MQLHQPCELGVFATVDIQAGQSLGPYAGNVINEPSKGQKVTALLSHARRIGNTCLLFDGAIVASMFRRYIPTTDAQKEKILEFTAEKFTPLKSVYSPTVMTRFHTIRF